MVALHVENRKSCPARSALRRQGHARPVKCWFFGQKMFLGVFCRIQIPDIPGGSDQGARRGGGAGSGRTGRRQNSSPRRHKASKTRRLNFAPEAPTSEILCKPMEIHSEWLTTCFYPRITNGARRTLCTWLLTSGPTPTCLLKPVSCKARPGKAILCV